MVIRNSPCPCLRTILLILTLIVQQVVLFCLALSSDDGGNTGFGLAFSNFQQYVSPAGNLHPSESWPVQTLTVSSWVRFLGFDEIGRQANCLLTLSTANDQNHVQPFFLQLIDGALYFTVTIAFSSQNIPLPMGIDLWTYWTKLTVTYNSSGSTSYSSLYINGSKLQSWSGDGSPLRFSDEAKLLLGGRSLSPTVMLSRDEFIGWVDEMAFFNRAMSDEELANTWSEPIDVTDPALCIFYDFNEIPDSSVIRNLGNGGHSADLYNGEVFGSQFFFDSVSFQYVNALAASWVPGAPGAAASRTAAFTPLPQTFSVGQAGCVCFQLPFLEQLPAAGLADDSTNGSIAVVTLFNGPGKLLEAPRKGSCGGTPLLTFPVTLESSSSHIVYFAPAVVMQSFVTFIEFAWYPQNKSREAINGSVAIVAFPPPIAKSEVVLPVLLDEPLVLFLAGTGSVTRSLLQAEVTALPSKGLLYQLNFSNPSSREVITSVPAIVSNPLLGLRYSPQQGQIGTDTLEFTVRSSRFSIGDNSSLPGKVTFQFQMFNYKPEIPRLTTDLTILNRESKVISLSTNEDVVPQHFLGVYITSLPSKGKLYQRMEDGSKGALIDAPFSQNVRAKPVYQYASRVVNVSSCRAGGVGTQWSPIESLGLRKCFSYGDCLQSWCPRTLAGTGGFASGVCAGGIPFAHNPDASFENFGWTEFIELQYNESVFVTEVTIGSSTGGGGVKNILAKDPLGNWKTIYSIPTVDWPANDLYDEFSLYLKFSPNPLCGTPFATNHLRFEMNTRITLNYWNEWDFFRLGGTLAADISAVRYTGHSAWDVIYEPHPTACGLDNFTYAASSCPTWPDDWSPHLGTVLINIIPTGIAGTITAVQGVPTVVSLSQWSHSSQSANNSLPLIFQIMALPRSGVLFNEENEIISVPATLTGSVVKYIPNRDCVDTSDFFAYTSSDPLQSAPVTVQVHVSCPRTCNSSDLIARDLGCFGNYHKIDFSWNPTNLLGCIPRSNVFSLPLADTSVPCGEVQWSTVSARLALSFAIVVGACALVCCLWIVCFRHAPAVRTSQADHLLFFCLGAIALQMSWLAYIQEASQQRCMMAPWLLSVSFSIVMGTLIRRISVRRRKILRDLGDQPQRLSHGFSLTRYSSQYLKGQLSLLQRHPFTIKIILVCIDVAILLPWTLFSPLHTSAKTVQLEMIHQSLVIPNYYCKSSDSTPFLTLLIVFKGAVAVLGAYLAFSLFTIDRSQSDSAMKTYAMYNIVVCTALLLVITTTSQNFSATSWLMTGSAVTFFAVMCAIIMLFLPKMRRHYVEVLMMRKLPIHAAIVTGEDPRHILKLIDDNKLAMTSKLPDAEGRTALIVAMDMELTDKDVMSELLALSLPVDPSSESMIDPEEHAYAWSRIVQHNKYSLVVDNVLRRFPHLAVVLARAEDEVGRAAVDIAAPQCKCVIQRQLYFFCRYDITTWKHPLHRTRTCVVHLAYDREDSDREVALKLMHFVDDFNSEIQTRSAGHLNGAYVVALLRQHSADSDESFRAELARKGLADYPHCIVMEAGECDLQHIIAREELDWDRVRSMSLRIALALQHMHHRGFIHGDLHPANIVRFHQDTKLIDLDSSIAFGRGSCNNIGSNYTTGFIPPEFIYFNKQRNPSVRSPRRDRRHHFLRKPVYDRWNIGSNIPCSGSSLVTRSQCSETQEQPPEQQQQQIIVHWSTQSHSVPSSSRTTNLRILEDQHEEAKEELKDMQTFPAAVQLFVSIPGVDEPLIPGNSHSATTISMFPSSFDLLAAEPSYDMWSLGMTMYCLAVGGHPLGCDGDGDLIDEHEMRIIAEWTDDFKRQKLSKITDPLARNLISLLLSKDPMHRPTIDAVVSHSFFTGRVPARLAEDAADYDVFLSYRFASDADFAEKLFHLLGKAGVRVWWDKACLLPGELWEEGFCKGLVRSAIFVPIISRNALNHPMVATQQVGLLAESSPCDSVLLEYRLSVELTDRGLIEKTFPVFIGDPVPTEPSEGTCGSEKDNEESAVEAETKVASEAQRTSSSERTASQQRFTRYTFNGPDACYPAFNDAVVEAVERKLCEHLETQGLGFPLLSSMKVGDILKTVTSYQGVFIEGVLDDALNHTVSLIQQMLLTVSYVPTTLTSSSRNHREDDSGGGGGSGGNNQTPSHISSLEIERMLLEDSDPSTKFRVI